MDTDRVREYCLDFINRLNYIIIYGSINSVNHINKIIYMKDKGDNSVLIRAVTAILFFNTPVCFLTFFKNKFEKEFKESFAKYKFSCILSDKLHEINNITKAYINTNIYSAFHLFHNDNIKLDKDIYNCLLGKMFNKDDNWFGNNIEDKSIVKWIPSYYTNKIVKLICDKYEGCITGSVALSYYGEVYRDKVKDIDLAINTKYLEKDINDIIDNQIHNKVIGKETIQIEEKLKDLFKQTALCKDILELIPNVYIKNISIDRVFEYDNYVRCNVILKGNSGYYDLMFKTNINRHYDINKDIYIQELPDIIYFKRVLNRPKDFRDLINFKLFNRNIIYKDKRCEEVI